MVQTSFTPPRLLANALNISRNRSVPKVFSLMLSGSCGRIHLSFSSGSQQLSHGWASEAALNSVNGIWSQWSRTLGSAWTRRMYWITESHSASWSVNITSTGPWLQRSAARNARFRQTVESLPPLNETIGRLNSEKIQSNRRSAASKTLRPVW